MISSNVYVSQIHNSLGLIVLWVRNHKSTKNASVKSMQPSPESKKKKKKKTMQPNCESANLLLHLAMDRPFPI